MSDLTSEQFNNIYKNFDPEETGKCKISDFPEIMKAFNIDLTEDELEDTLEQLEQLDTHFNFGKFLERMSSKIPRDDGKIDEKELEYEFADFDMDKDFYISKEDYMAFLKSVNENYTDTHVNNFIRTFDKDGDGKVSLADYKSTVLEAYRST